MLKVLVVSDTHGVIDNLEKVLELEKPFDYLIHCGDVEEQEDYIEVLAEVPCTFVAGNCDYYSDLPHADIVELEGIRAFVTHGHYLDVSYEIEKLLDTAKENRCTFAFFGHTHRPEHLEQDGIVAVNPGSLTYPRQAGRHPSYAVVQILNGKKAEVILKEL